MARPDRDNIWCSTSAITPEEFARHSSKNMSRFNYACSIDTPAEILSALETIAEHHPDQRVWVEHRPDAIQN